ncbi:DUF3299 domain-containing protein [Mesorhizobium sp. B2-4-19]|uniref:DUF3299 domain-containing protein n=1 Tax=Mesorhizobium sp. B2-4-19 TaxID=2589930 RepID=UPI001FEF58E6|nr:DUF3299 domain-containing protein [Mesorhizobium sp. B2-4-19]
MTSLASASLLGRGGSGMSIHFKSILALATALSLCAAGASAETMHIFWKDLRPASQAVAEDAGLPMIAAKLADHGETLSLGLQDKTVQLAGYALPVDRDGDLVYQFLLVPWTGACSHMPTPPANQIVLVTPAHPYKMSQAYQSVAVTGALKPDMEKSQLFILDGVSVIRSGYSVRRADVVGVDTVPDAITLPVNSPWTFLNKKKN